MATEMFLQMAGIELPDVGYRGGGPAVQALLANEAFLDGRMTTNLLDRVGGAAFLAAAARA